MQKVKKSDKMKQKHKKVTPKRKKVSSGHKNTQLRRKIALWTQKTRNWPSKTRNWTSKTQKSDSKTKKKLSGHSKSLYRPSKLEIDTPRGPLWPPSEVHLGLVTWKKIKKCNRKPAGSVFNHALKKFQMQVTPIHKGRIKFKSFNVSDWRQKGSRFAVVEGYKNQSKFNWISDVKKWPYEIAYRMSWGCKLGVVKRYLLRFIKVVFFNLDPPVTS